MRTPEFGFEHERARIEGAVARFGLPYAVAEVNDYATWRAWRNRYWPAHMLVDRNGGIVLQHFGEGDYTAMENAIRQAAPVHSGTRRYSISAKLPRNRFAVGGNWTLADESATLSEGAGSEGAGSEGAGEIAVRFRAAKVHLVASSDAPASLSVAADGGDRQPITIHRGRLYTVFDGDTSAERVMRLAISDPGVGAYTVTLG